MSDLGCGEGRLLTARRPSTIIITLPNREYNRQFNLADGEMRHHGHRFEWIRPEFRE